MNDSDLLDRAKSGALSPEEIDEVAEALQAEKAGRDPYTLIHILGRSGAIRYRGLVERFLDCRSDPMLVRLALQVLCSHWNLAAEYEDALVRFAEGVDWDGEEEVRLVALSAAGELLRHGQSERLKHLLARVFTDSSASQMARQAAYFALARASGKAWRDLPPASRVLDLETETDPEVVSWAMA